MPVKKNKVTPGVFLFGTDRVKEFLDLGFPFVSIGNDLHHVLTQTGEHIKKIESLQTKEGKKWTRQHTSML